MSELERGVVYDEVVENKQKKGVTINEDMQSQAPSKKSKATTKA